jgi:hypothetical protein
MPGQARLYHVIRDFIRLFQFKSGDVKLPQIKPGYARII